MHKVLIGIVATGAVVIAGIGFAGSYAAVHDLAVKKGFGNFAYVFPIGIDAGIVVLLGLDLLLTWIRIPFPLLRHAAWLLTAATIAFNGAAAWPDPLGVGMHAVIPVLFVVSVEAARHAIGRIADITADKHMEGVRLSRWMLSPLPTFLLWRRMKLWELRSYEQVVKMEQERLVYQARLRQRFGKAWRRKAPVESLMPLRLSRYGVPLHETAPAGLEAAGIEVPAELERVDRSTPEELPVLAVPELEPVPVDVDPVHAQDAPDASEAPAGPDSVSPPELPVPDPYEAHEPVLTAFPESGDDPYDHPQTDGRLAGAGSPLAARGNGRRPIVQARIDAPELSESDLLAAAMSEKEREWQLLADRSTPSAPGHSLDPLSVVQEEEEAATVEPSLTGVDLLEYRYLRLPPEERSKSAVKLAELLHEGSGFTAGTARKYLGGIIRKHAEKSQD
ncbi:DUF2637 domain-containing protein [Streptomyces sp. LN325]|uniref:DUF2637 domain-containing protein n=1 Tax=Streptomyces sp. LN325 TaxID=3112976 RepID=UPI00371CA261